jgi:hypothetical protein
MVDVPSRRRGHRVAHVLVVIGAIEGLAALGAGVASAMAWGDAILLAIMYAAPAIAVGLVLDSAIPRRVTMARIAATCLALVYSAIVVGNWSGYDRRQAILVPLLTAPLVAVYLAAAFPASDRKARG